MNLEKNLKIMKCIDRISNGHQILENIKIPYDDNIVFSKINTVYEYVPKNVKILNYIAAFDLDWTLVYSEKHLYPNDPDDISILPYRFNILEKLIKIGYTLVIFSNQYAKSVKEKEKKILRLINFLKKIKLPIFTYISTEKDVNRKPEIGMWKIFRQRLTQNIDKLLFIGDAIGRPQDFSDSDKIFGERIGAEIYSPDIFFPKSGRNINFQKNNELVIFVGAPGVGKTTYYNDYLTSHIHINQDKLKTKAKVMSEFEKNIKTGRPIVIDSTNPTQDERQIFYDKAKEYGYSIKTIYFLIDGHGFNKLREKVVPDLVYHMYYKKLEPPTIDNVPGELIYVT